MQASLATDCAGRTDTSKLMLNFVLSFPPASSLSLSSPPAFPAFFAGFLLLTGRLTAARLMTLYTTT